MTDYSGDASLSCRISTITELSDSRITGGFKRDCFIASNAVLSPSKEAAPKGLKFNGGFANAHIPLPSGGGFEEQPGAEMSDEAFNVRVGTADARVALRDSKRATHVVVDFVA